MPSSRRIIMTVVICLALSVFGNMAAAPAQGRVQIVTCLIFRTPSIYIASIIRHHLRPLSWSRPTGWRAWSLR